MTRADDWPQWRGPTRDGVWAESGLVTSFPAEGLTVRWRRHVGYGWSTPVVSRGRVFVSDVRTDTRPVQERVHCFDEDTGNSVWTYTYDEVYPDWSLEGDHLSPPCATPIAEAGRLYVVGANGYVHCLAASTGNVIWENNLPKKFEIGQLSCRPSPLIEGDLLILLIGGKPDACVVALSKDSGKLVWKSLAESISNSSPIVVTAGGTRQLIVWTGESTTSLLPKTGAVKWRERLITSSNDSTATPVCESNRLLISGFMLKLHPDKPLAVPVWPKSRAVPRRVLSNTSTPLLKGDYVYSVRSSGELVCLDARTGEQVWTTDKVTSLSFGASINITPNGDLMWLFTDEGNLILARLAPQGFQELGRAHLLEPTTLLSIAGKRFAWVPPAYANRHVFARNDKELICVSLAAKP